MPAVSNAALVLTSESNTLNNYTAILNWTVTTELVEVATIGCTPTSTVFSCTPWLPVQLQAIQIPSVSIGQLTLSIQHLIGPHGNDINPGTAVGLQILSVLPGSGNGSLTVSTPHNPHSDRVTLSVAAISAGLSQITITADHFAVPEPGTMALGLLGGTALASGRWLRRRKA